MMKEWLEKLVFVLVLLLLLLPSRYEVGFVSDLYHRHPWLVVLFGAAILGVVGWWLRRQTELKVKTSL